MRWAVGFALLMAAIFALSLGYHLGVAYIDHAAVAAGGVVLDLGEQAKLREAAGDGVDLVGGFDFDAEVIHHRRLIRLLAGSGPG